MRRFKKIALSVVGIILLILGLDCEARRDAVNNGVCYFGGQGRDRYGR